MTDARDELAGLIRTSLNADSRLVDRGYVGENDVYDTADAIIAAGWSSPRDEREEKILDAMGAWDDE